MAALFLVAGITNVKYVNEMPLAHQKRKFTRYGSNLLTENMANWNIPCADRYLQLLKESMKKELLRSSSLHDETHIQVIDVPSHSFSQNWMQTYLMDEHSGLPRMIDAAKLKSKNKPSLGKRWGKAYFEMIG